MCIWEAGHQFFVQLSLVYGMAKLSLQLITCLYFTRIVNPPSNFLRLTFALSDMNRSGASQTQ